MKRHMDKTFSDPMLDKDRAKERRSQRVGMVVVIIVAIVASIIWIGTSVKFCWNLATVHGL